MHRGARPRKALSRRCPALTSAARIWAAAEAQARLLTELAPALPCGWPHALMGRMPPCRPQAAAEAELGP